VKGIRDHIFDKAAKTVWRYDLTRKEIMRRATMGQVTVHGISVIFSNFGTFPKDLSMKIFK
jgi:hypothetical protein